MPRALLITYEFPPMGGVGVQRPVQLAKQLPRTGWDVTVLTVEDPPSAMRDLSLLDELPPSVNVRRAWSLEPTRLIQLVRRVMSGKPAVTPAHSKSVPETPRSGFSGMPPWLIRAVQALFIPDEKRLWRGRARREAVAAIAEESIEAIISSGPPHTAHLIGYDVARASGLPWVVDLRDPWVGNYFFVPPTPIHAALQRRWERRVVEAASAVLVVSDPMAEDLRRRHPDLSAGRFIVVPNGFDPDEMPAQAPASDQTLEIMYLGAFQGAISPDTFLSGLKSAVDTGSVPRSAVRFVSIGPSGDQVRSIAETLGVGDIVETVGFLGHREALERAAVSDVALLVLPAGTASRAILTGKLLEYLGLGKTILALAPDGAAADLVREAGAGLVVAPNDPRAVANALADMYLAFRDARLPVPAADVVARYDRRVQMRQVAGILDELTFRSAS